MSDRKGPAVLPDYTQKEGGISIAAWKRHTAKGETWMVKIDKRYRDANGVWHSTNSFFPNEVRTLTEMLRKVTLDILSDDEIGTASQTPAPSLFPEDEEDLPF